MGNTNMTTALGAYLAAVGVSTSAAAFCMPYLTGEKHVPTEVDKALDQSAARIADGITVTFVEAAKRKGVSRSTIWRMVQDGTIKAVNVRGKNRVILGSLERAFAPASETENEASK